MKITVNNVNQSTIETQNGQFFKYGIQTRGGGDEWLNIVDWERIYDDGGISEGDEIQITEPEKGEYGWEADFIEPTGFSTDEKILRILQEKVVPALREMRDELGDTQEAEEITPEQVDEAMSQFDKEDAEEIGW